MRADTIGLLAILAAHLLGERRRGGKIGLHGRTKSGGSTRISGICLNIPDLLRFTKGTSRILLTASVVLKSSFAKLLDLKDTPHPSRDVS